MNKTFLNLFTANIVIIITIFSYISGLGYESGFAGRFGYPESLISITYKSFFMGFLAFTCGYAIFQPWVDRAIRCIFTNDRSKGISPYPIFFRSLCMFAFTFFISFIIGLIQAQWLISNSSFKCFKLNDKKYAIVTVSNDIVITKEKANQDLSNSITLFKLDQLTGLEIKACRITKKAHHEGEQ